MMIIVVYDLTCKLYTHIIVRNPRPQSDNRRGWLWCEDHMCSLSVKALLRYFMKRSTLITSRFPWGPTANGLVGQKMSCKFLIASTYDYLRNTCLVRLKRIYNFWCSMLVYTPFALCFVTLHGDFMHFPDITYKRDTTVPVPCFLLFLCFRKATQEIFSELDKTKAEPPIFPEASQSPKMRRRGARGRWYVSNVSIIFDAPCLFIHHLLCVLLYFVAFLCVFWN
jgi:hypothetical protein